MPYTYHIAWSKHDIHYYGVRIAHKSDPKTDLWKNYFTSSKFVKKFRAEHGEPDIVEIRKEFFSEEIAIKWESRVLTKLKVRHNLKWLNKYDSTYKGSTKPKTEDHKRKIGLGHKGKKQSWVINTNKNPEKISKTAEKHRGMKRTVETVKKLTEHHRNRIAINGGANNKGHKIYYNPEKISEIIQCIPGHQPINWIQGNPTTKGKITFKHKDTGAIKRFAPDSLPDENWIKIPGRNKS